MTEQTAGLFCCLRRTGAPAEPSSRCGGVSRLVCWCLPWHEPEPDNRPHRRARRRAQPRRSPSSPPATCPREKHHATADATRESPFEKRQGGARRLDRPPRPKTRGLGQGSLDFGKRHDSRLDGGLAGVGRSWCLACLSEIRTASPSPETRTPKAGSNLESPCFFFCFPSHV